MSKRTNQAPALDQGTVPTEHLPPSRPPKRISTQVRPPLAGVSLSSFIYVLVAISALYLGAQSLNIANWSILGKSDVSRSAAAATDAKDAIKDKLSDIGKSGSGVSGKIPQASAGTGNSVLTIEQRIQDLASALGMPAGDLAGAIAVAVREFVPPATLSSISSQAKATPHGTLVDVLLGETQSASAADGQPTAPGGVGGILGSVVGMDEPPTEDA